jgi:hypothetical protein
MLQTLAIPPIRQLCKFRYFRSTSEARLGNANGSSQKADWFSSPLLAFARNYFAFTFIRS